MKPATVKQVLDEAILKVPAAPSAYVYNPEKEFSRNRKLPFQEIIKMLIGMGGNSLGKELWDWFGYSNKTVATSAFVQQRNKINPEALKDIFQTMISQCEEHLCYKDYR